MQIRKILVTGEPLFLHRHQFVFEEMHRYFDKLEYLPSSTLYETKLREIIMKVIYGITYVVSPKRASSLRKNARAFITRSQKTEQKIRQLEYNPDLIFHMLSMYSPFWDRFDIPYAMYLDYTMALAKKNWLPWAPFNDQKEFADWVNCEQIVYEKSRYLFTMSNRVKSSLVEDYGIKPEKITVVGSSGNFKAPYDGEKAFGSKQILFNGSDFKRKGGDLVLAAFRQVKRSLPEAKLVIIGKKLNIHENGVNNPGRITSATEMRNLFLKTDLVVAPAYCDPFPTFLMEAMNYGVPCIVSANDGMPEIIDNRVNGVVITQPTPELIANHILNLLQDIPTLISMSRNAQQKIRTQLNWNSIAKKITQVLSK